MADLFEQIYGQPQVRNFLRAIFQQEMLTHAYLFTGPAGSNKTTAAYAFAQAILEHAADNQQERDVIVRKAKKRNHPDIHYIEPQGAQGYILEQVRSLISDVMLAPLESKRKVYILDRVDLLGVASANAFLKTLEEPPSHTTFILLGRTQSGVLPTIVSRCQIVPFRLIPPSEAEALLIQNTACTPQDARIAIQSCSGSLSGAVRFLRTPERRAFRETVLRVMSLLARADDVDVLEYAQEIVKDSKAPLDAFEHNQKEELSKQSQYLQQSAIRALEQRQKRALTKETRTLLAEMTSIIRSWLRDCMMLLSNQGDLVVNIDALPALQDCTQRTNIDKLNRAFSYVDATDKAISYNVGAQLSIEVLLFQIREVLYA